MKQSMCWCYEKFKDSLPPGTKTVCFKDKCANYRKHTQTENKSSPDR